ncbi:hypothetical protein JRB95_001372 [Listeria monocytogenes]|nr:hypothetical protein [Listeria monocytogenes]
MESAAHEQELVKYLEEILEESYFFSEKDLVRLGFNLAIAEVRLYEAKQRAIEQEKKEEEE